MSRTIPGSPRLPRAARRMAFLLAAFIPVAIIPACGGDGSTGPGTDAPAGDSPFSATVEGVSWSASAATQQPMVVIGAGWYTMTGFLGSGADVRAIAIALMNIPGPGTYPLGTGANVPGGTATYAEAAAGWSTLPLTGDLGEIVITRLDASRAAGTFHFVGHPTSGGATGTRTVTNGAFDLPVSGTVGPVPDRNRNILRATIAGEAWLGATAVTTGNPATTLTWLGNDTRQTLNMTLRGITEPGTFDLSAGGNTVTVSVGSGSGGTPCCWSSTADGAAGTVIVTSVTASRCAGSFSFTIPPIPGTDATDPISVTDGFFDVGF